MKSDMYQVDVTFEGIGSATKTSKVPGPNQSIVIDYLYYYFYAAHTDDLAQVDTSATSPINRKTLLYFSPAAAVHYAPIALQLNLKLNRGETFTAYVRGQAATSSLTILVWYHIEDEYEQVNQYPMVSQPCGFIDNILGRC